MAAADQPGTVFEYGLSFDVLGAVVEKVSGKSLGGAQVLSPATVRLMTSNHLGAGIQNRVAAVEPHRDGYGFGLGVAVRQRIGRASNAHPVVLCITIH